MISERMKAYFDESRAIAIAPPQSSFNRDLHKASSEIYADLPRWENQARSMAYAVTNQNIHIKPYDKLIGRVYYRNEIKPEKISPHIDFNTVPRRESQETDPVYTELAKYQFVTYGTPGHIAWDWNFILKRGTEGIRKRCLNGLSRKAGDEKAEQFYNGVLIMLDALEEWNEKHIEELVKMGKTEEAEICRRVPKYPARTFREALQSFFIQHITVMKEDPHGGNSPGRLDYYLWPYLEADLAAGRCTLEEAEELIEELFIRIDERLYYMDTWAEVITLGGTYPSGASSVNPLSYIMIRACMKYDIIHPLVYARLSKNSPEDFVKLCADFVVNGKNRAQLLCDEAIIGALIENGVTETDAVDYVCGGCMEVGIQGRTSDFLFNGYHNLPKLLELCMTGGYSLTDKQQLEHFHHKPLTEFDSFEDFYASFINEAKRVLTLHLDFQDRLSAYSEEMRPAYLQSSMIDDCITKGRNMHGGGARYHDYGSSVIGLPNTADSLTAIKKAVFDEKICTAEQLLCALKADFEGYEELRKKLLALPKYGQENAEADAMAQRVATDLNRIFAGYVNRFGGNGKLVMLTFVWGPVAGGILGATPDGRRAKTPVAHSVTPQGMAMTEGITAAMNSCCTLPFELFSGAASTMWDLDPSIATPDYVAALIKSFFSMGGQIFQGNMTDVEELKKALEAPESYKHLIVRVGGYSARFVNLKKELQTEIIERMRHKR